jgi:predicted lipoprotein
VNRSHAGRLAARHPARRLAAGSLLSSIAALAVTCAPVPLGDGAKKTVVREIATSVILPTLEEAAVRAGAMRSAIEQLADGPSQESLDSAQQAWRSARIPWKETEAFSLGPAKDLRLAPAIDQVPVDVAKIDLEIGGAWPLTESYVETLGANRKGFHAIEYFLFRGEDDAFVLASLTTDPLAPRRREFLVALSQNLEGKATELRTAWAAEGGNYLARLTEPGTSNGTYPTIKSVIDALVNESIFVCELIANERLGVPLGTASGGLPQPDRVESGPSDNSIADMAASLRGVRNVYSGIGQLVAAQSPAADQAVRAAFDEGIRSVEAIPRPYHSALTEQRPAVNAAYEAVKALKRTLATEVVAVLGTTLKFNDNDGD